MRVPNGEGALAKLRRIRGVSWIWRDDAPADARASANMGVLAQDVERVFPQLVHQDDNGIKSVEYHGLIAPVIEAIKELDERLQAVEETLRQQGAAG